MLELLLVPTLMGTPIKNEALQTFEQHKIVEVVEVPPPPPELSLEDKIKLNINNCNTDTHWISAEDATCLVKTQPQPARVADNAPQGWYPYGQCTYWVWSKRPVGQWNDATDWKWQAQRDGWTVSPTPIVGAIAWEPGHVMYVEAVNDTTVKISEMNYKGRGVVTYRTRPITDLLYIY